MALWFSLVFLQTAFFVSGFQYVSCSHYLRKFLSEAIMANKPRFIS